MKSYFLLLVGILVSFTCPLRSMFPALVKKGTKIAVQPPSPLVRSISIDDFREIARLIEVEKNKLSGNKKDRQHASEIQKLAELIAFAKMFNGNPPPSYWTSKFGPQGATQEART